jgi:hypothetical protein
MGKNILNEEIKNMKFLFGYKPGKVISEQDMGYTPEMSEDLEFEEEETMESILEKHNLLDEILHKGNNRIMIKDKSSEVVQRLLSIIHLFDKLIFLAILDCESADFSDVDICGLTKISFINLTGTENNFEEQGYECAEGDNFDDSNSFYYIP